MNDQIRGCGHTPPAFLVTYFLGSIFIVCDSCILLKHWSRGIKEKTRFTDLKNKLPEGIVSGRSSLMQTTKTEVTNSVM